ncbi:siderophore ABC transporter substrate-binding protein [Mycetocola spongiae]|uniref:siderophore ABC transporter substrate-binding protein n=1 Tax=Mycetocola spongiae TaxID=2859226 RepID=UPI001CF1E375|nr:ABC transporter substrate-binding protein [Mycetocola spongiae]UCR88452.1 ABC transporter substrate-binding protein [Mycetocola spongiae]
MTSTIRRSLLGATALLAALALAGCSTASTPEKSGEAASTITVKAANGSIEVPVNPQKVVALDNTSFETLRDWGITPVAVPKPLLPKKGYEEWINNKDIVDIGNHREPDLEALSAVDADLVIGGYRFGEYTEKITEMGIAPVIDISADQDAAGGWTGSLKTQTTTLGEIFDKKDKAAETVKTFEAAEKKAGDATSGESVFLGVVSGGKLDNGAKRIGHLLEPLNLKDVFAGEGGDVHGDSGLAPETIAQANPDWVIVMDRDAAVGGKDVSPAKQIIDAQEAFANTTFAQKGHVIYLDPFFYTREGIQSYTEAFDQIAEAFTKG